MDRFDAHDVIDPVLDVANPSAITACRDHFKVRKSILAGAHDVTHANRRRLLGRVYDAKGCCGPRHGADFLDRSVMGWSLKAARGHQNIVYELVSGPGYRGAELVRERVPAGGDQAPVL